MKPHLNIDPGAHNSNPADTDNELVEDSAAVPPGVPDARVEAIVPSKPVEPPLDRFKPRYTPIEPRRSMNPIFLILGVVIAIAIVAFAGWYLGIPPDGVSKETASQAVQSTKENQDM
jgi:hypothetical protein